MSPTRLFLSTLTAVAVAGAGIAGLTALNPGSPPRTNLERIALEGFPEDLGPHPGTGIYKARWGAEHELPPTGPLPAEVLDDVRTTVVTTPAGTEWQVAVADRVRALTAAGRPALVLYEDEGEGGVVWVAAPPRLLGQPPYAAYTLHGETREDARTLADAVIDAVPDGERWVVIDATD